MDVKKIILLLIVALFSVVCIFPQDNDDAGFFFKYDDKKKPVFIQKISWEKSPYAVKYNFILKNSAGEVVTDQDVEVNYIESSLPPGNYTYKVTAYNVLEQAEQDSGWIDLVIEKAFLPVILSLSTDTVYLEKNYGDPIIIMGKEFTDKVRVELKDLTNLNRPVIVGVIKDLKDFRLEVAFKKEDFIQGNYELRVINPGNIYDTKPFKVKYKKPVDFMFTVGWAPMINGQSGDFNKLLINTFYPLGAQVDLLLLPIKLRYGFMGFGLTSDFVYIHDTKAVSLYGFFWKNSLTFNYLYQFNKYVGFLVRVGGGMNFTGLLFDYGDPLINRSMISLDPLVTAGLALKITPYRGCSVVIGADYSQTIFKDSFFGTVEPYIATGYYF